MLITRGFSLTNFIIGTSALTFQVLVLFPWHEKLDREFKTLREEHQRLLQDQLVELRTIRQDFERSLPGQQQQTKNLGLLSRTSR